MKQYDVVRRIASLAHPARLQAFRALVVAGPSGLTPGVLSERLGISPTALSFHLKALMHSGLVNIERDGRNRFYRASFEHMNDLLAYLTRNCCGGVDCGVPAPTRGKPARRPVSR